MGFLFHLILAALREEEDISNRIPRTVEQESMEDEDGIPDDDLAAIRLKTQENGYPCVGKLDHKDSGNCVSLCRTTIKTQKNGYPFVGKLIHRNSGNWVSLCREVGP